MTVHDLADAVSSFTTLAHVERFRLLGWYVHRVEGKPRFTAADTRRLYRELAIPEPANYSQQLNDLYGSKGLLKDAGGFFLPRDVREVFDRKYGDRPSRIAVHNLLSSLPERVPNVAERVFLQEALDCFSVRAFRATVVMTWNLAYDHLCNFILMQHRDAFNRQWPITYPKHHTDARISEVAKVEDFAELKESQVIKICRSASIITGDVEKILAQKLERRNSAAHPSGVAIEQLQAEEFIDDLVKNVVFKLV